MIAPQPEVSASIAELEKQATKDKPKLQEVARPKAKEVSKKKMSDQGAKLSKKFDWNNLIEYTRKNHVALFSVLSKCGYTLDGQDLTLYTVNTFYKKKLDDPKYSPLIYSCLEKLGVFELTIHTIPTAVPPSDKQAAAVAAIMGGGEEVSLETI